MNLANLVGRGYLPNVLPKTFSSTSLGDFIVSGGIDSSYAPNPKITKPILFSAPKIGHSRRVFSIPNPIQQVALSQLICSNWEAITTHCAISLISFTTPVENTEDEGRATYMKSFANFKYEAIEKSEGKLFELKADISRFFPTIYTHVIPWAMHGQSAAKRDSRSKMLLGSKIDAALQAGCHGQTHGIPIGPDTSHIISEIVLATLDEKLTRETGALFGYRYVDDYCLYFDTFLDAEKALVALRSILMEYGLDIAEEKTEIRQMPIAFESPCIHEMRDFKIDAEHPGKQKKGLWSFFNMGFDFAKRFPKEHILKFAAKSLIGRIQDGDITVQPENWPLLQAFLLKTVGIESELLELFYFSLQEHRESMNQKVLPSFIFSLLHQHANKRHDLEVVWLLHIIKLLELEAPAKLIDLVLEKGNAISRLVALDIIESQLVEGDVDIGPIQEINNVPDNLATEHWLLVYEASQRRMYPINSATVRANEFFHNLQQAGVSFYSGEDARLEWEDLASGRYGEHPLSILRSPF